PRPDINAAGADHGLAKQGDDRLEVAGPGEQEHLLAGLERHLADEALGDGRIVEWSGNSSVAHQEDSGEEGSEGLSERHGGESLSKIHDRALALRGAGRAPSRSGLAGDLRPDDRRPQPRLQRLRPAPPSRSGPSTLQPDLRDRSAAVAELAEPSGAAAVAGGLFARRGGEVPGEPVHAALPRRRPLFRRLRRSGQALARVSRLSLRFQLGLPLRLLQLLPEPRVLPAGPRLLVAPAGAAGSAAGAGDDGSPPALLLLAHRGHRPRALLDRRAVDRHAAGCDPREPVAAASVAPADPGTAGPAAALVHPVAAR